MSVTLYQVRTSAKAIDSQGETLHTQEFKSLIAAVNFDRAIELNRQATLAVLATFMESRFHGIAYRTETEPQECTPVAFGIDIDPTLISVKGAVSQ